MQFPPRKNNKILIGLCEKMSSTLVLKGNCIPTASLWCQNLYEVAPKCSYLYDFKKKSFYLSISKSVEDYLAHGIQQPIPKL